MTIKEEKGPVRRRRAKLPAARNARPGKYLRSEERRAQILASAREVFTRVGPQGARTRDLAKAAGINQATMFSHFDSKEALFIAAVIEPLQAAMKNVAERSLEFRQTRSEEARESLSRESALRILRTADELYPSLAVGLFSDREAGRKLYVDHVYPALRERGKAMQASLRDGIDGEVLSIALFGIAMAFCADRTFRNLSSDLGDLASQMSDIILHGCAP